MGQTLPNGIYLPAEGERNCYDGLEGNWRSLDSLISTVAGKASATHTHGNITNDGKVGTDANKPLITGTGGAVQAGSFGNAANTFCEGNDSRLSDARTPLAHTHTKSDVTDLLNSNFIPSANNSYDLGSSSYQWNNLYAKSYYYNGVAWGLDKNNTWSAVNQYSREIQLAGDRNAFIAPMWEGAGSGMAFLVSDASKAICFGTWTDDANNNNRKIIDGTKGRMIIRVGEKNSETYLEVEPRASNAALGNSTNKWKSLNGINPGALSLPRGYTEEGADKHYINIASVIQTLDGTLYNYTMPDNGWICVRAEQAQQIHVTLQSWSFGQSISHPTGSTLIVSVPFRKNDQISLKVKAVTLQYARFYPMQGNV